MDHKLNNYVRTDGARKPLVFDSHPKIQRTCSENIARIPEGKESSGEQPRGASNHVMFGKEMGMMKIDAILLMIQQTNIQTPISLGLHGRTVRRGKLGPLKGTKLLLTLRLSMGNRWEPPKSTNIMSKSQMKQKCESIRDEMNAVDCESIIK